MALFDVTIPVDAIVVADEVFVNPVEVRFDQGVSLGSPNCSRSDIVAGTAVDVINVTPGATNAAELLWKPPDDDAAVLTPNGDDWQITPKTGTWGTYTIALTVDGITVIHTFTVLSPIRKIDPGAANEKANPAATLAQWIGKYISDAFSNEPLTAGGKKSAFGWWGKFWNLVKAVEGSREIGERVNSTDSDTASGTTPVDKMSIVIPDEDGTWEITGHAKVSHSNSTGNPNVWLENITDSVELGRRWVMEMEDPANNIHTPVLFAEFSNTEGSGAKTIAMRYSVDPASGTMTISDAYFTKVKVSG